MPFLLKSLTDLRNQARSDFASKLEGADSLLRFSDISVSADVMAGLTYEQFCYLAWLSRQVFPDQAEKEWLERWSGLYGLPRKPPTAAAGPVVVTGNPGAVVPAGCQLQRADGQTYSTVAAVAVDALTSKAIVAVRADLAAAAGDCLAGQPLTITAPPPGIAPAAIVGGGGLVGGADQELDDDLRQRLLQRIQFAPAGGAGADYISWALEVPGVTRAWVVGNAPNFGDVTIYFMMDAVRSAHRGIPQGSNGPQFGGDQLTVYNAIAPLRPVTAKIWPTAPAPKPINITVSNLTPNNPTMQAAVKAELQDLFVRATSPGGTVYISTIWQSVAAASGEQHHLITMPPGDVACATGEIAVLGAVSFV